MEVYPKTEARRQKPEWFVAFGEIIEGQPPGRLCPLHNSMKEFNCFCSAVQEGKQSFLGQFPSRAWEPESCQQPSWHRSAVSRLIDLTGIAPILLYFP
jgi:hypothetical protein